MIAEKRNQSGRKLVSLIDTANTSRLAINAVVDESDGCFKGDLIGSRVDGFVVFKEGYFYAFVTLKKVRKEEEE